MMLQQLKMHREMFGRSNHVISVSLAVRLALTDIPSQPALDQSTERHYLEPKLTFTLPAALSTGKSTSLSTTLPNHVLGTLYKIGSLHPVRLFWPYRPALVLLRPTY